MTDIRRPEWELVFWTWLIRIAFAICAFVLLMDRKYFATAVAVLWMLTVRATRSDI